MSLAQFYTSYLHDSVATSFRIVIRYFYRILGLPWWLSGKESACSAGNPGLIPGSGRSPGEGMATPSSLLACKVPWTEEPVGYSPWGRKELAMTAWVNFRFERAMLFTHGSTAVSVRTLEVFCLHSVAWNSETALGLPRGCWGNTGLGSPLLPRLLGSPESWSYSFGGFFTLTSVDISLYR